MNFEEMRDFIAQQFAENMQKVADELSAINRRLDEGTNPGAEVLTLAAAAKRLSVSAKTIQRMVADGRLRTTVIGQRNMIAASEVSRVARPATTTKKQARELRRQPDFSAQAESERLRQLLRGRGS